MVLSKVSQHADTHTQQHTQDTRLLFVWFSLYQISFRLMGFKNCRAMSSDKTRVWQGQVQERRARLEGVKDLRLILMTELFQTLHKSEWASSCLHMYTCVVPVMCPCIQRALNINRDGGFTFNKEVSTSLFCLYLGTFADLLSQCTQSCVKRCFQSAYD